MDIIGKALNIKKVEKGYVLGKNGDITIPIQIYLGEYCNFSKEELENLNENFKNATALLVNNVIIHRQDIYYNKIAKLNIIGDGFLGRASKKYYNEKPYMSSIHYIFLTKKYNNFNIKNYNEKEIKEFKNSAIRFLDSIDIKYKILNNDEYIDYLNNIFSLNFSKKETPPFLDLDFEKKIIGDLNINIHCLDTPKNISSPSYTILNKERNNSFTNVVNSFVAPLTFQIPYLHIVNNYIKIPPKEEIIKIIKSKNKEVSLISEKWVRDNNEYLDLLDENIGVLNHFNIISFSAEKDNDKLNSYLNRAFAEMQIRPYKASIEIEKLYLSMIGGNEILLPQYMYFYTFLEEAGIFNNWEGPYSQNKKGIVLQDLLGNPILLDLYDAPREKGIITSWNKIIFGPTGTGKSYFVNYMISSIYEMGHHIIIIDIGASYKKLCHLVNGEYKELDPEKKDSMSFNPFIIDITKKLDDEYIDFLKSLLIIAWGKERKNISSEEETSIGDIIKDFYKEINTTKDYHKMSFDGIYYFIKDNIKNYKYFEADKFLHVTKKYTNKGQYGYLLNGNENVNLSTNRFVVFELEKVKKINEIFNITVAIIINYSLTIIKNSNAPMKDIFLDECWAFLSNGEMGAFLKYLAKTIRKVGGSSNIILQEIGDLVNTKDGEAIISNSDTIIHLSPEGKEDAVIKYASNISLKKTDLNKLLSIKKASHEVFIKQGGISNVYKVKTPLEHFVCFNTDKDKKNKFEELMKKNQNNMPLSIQEYIEEEKSK